MQNPLINAKKVKFDGSMDGQMDRWMEGEMDKLMDVRTDWRSGLLSRVHVTKGAFLVKDDRVLKGSLGRSLRSFARIAHSAHLLRSFGSLTLSTGSLTHFAHSLVGQ